MVDGTFRSNLCLLALSHLEIREWERREGENEIFIFSAFRENFLSHISRLLIKTGDRPAAGGGLRDRILGGHQAPRQEAAGEMEG